jgi:hypothetical protein
MLQAIARIYQAMTCVTMVMSVTAWKPVLYKTVVSRELL